MAGGTWPASDRDGGRRPAADGGAGRGAEWRECGAGAGRPQIDLGGPRPWARGEDERRRSQETIRGPNTGKLIKQEAGKIKTI